MPPELRKRKTAGASDPEPAPAAKKQKPVAKIVEKVKKATAAVSKTIGSTSSGKVSVGDTINIEGFGSVVETNDGDKTTLKELVDKSDAGVVIFTYPAASTPGCTKQACMFRDQYADLTSTGLDIYGLSNNTPKSNTTFKTKQNLSYTLLCDPDRTLISAIGLKRSDGKTIRGVFVVDKSGKVLLAAPDSPLGTVERVKKLVEELKAGK